MYKLKHLKNSLSVSFTLNIGVLRVSIHCFSLFTPGTPTHSHGFSSSSNPRSISGPNISLTLQTTMSNLDVPQIIQNPHVSRKGFPCLFPPCLFCSITCSHSPKQKTRGVKYSFIPLLPHHLYSISRLYLLKLLCSSWWVNFYPRVSPPWHCWHLGQDHAEGLWRGVSCTL